MLEFIGSGLLGSIFGGLFRIAPEIIRVLDRANERKHELNMFRLQTDLEKVRGEFRMEGKYVDHSVAQLDAISEAFKEQSKTASSSYKWVAAASAMVRPGITYIVFLLYVFFKLIMIWLAWSSHIDWITIINNNWTNEDFAMLNMILTFWFVGRSIERYTSRTPYY
jgi:hypothetical protein